ncbi:MAG: hypothetical protein HQL44_03330 [Alphaproteobacteria bacterium]|nr:hypothetical protein [Alphaproteobacteria bacterium]
MRIDLQEMVESGGLRALPIGLILSAVVLALNLGFWGLGLPEIEAETERLQAEQGRLGGEVSALDGKIAALRKELSGMREMTDSYKSEMEKGTFEPENRLRANELLADIKARHVALSWLEPFSEYRLNIEPGGNYAVSAGGKSYNWFASPVHINIEMVHDRHFYQFAYDAMNSLSGVTLLKKMRLERKSRQAFVKDVENRKNDAKLTLPINAELEFMWVTADPPAKQGADDKKGRR